MKKKTLFIFLVPLVVIICAALVFLLNWLGIFNMQGGIVALKFEKREGNTEDKNYYLLSAGSFINEPGTWTYEDSILIGLKNKATLGAKPAVAEIAIKTPGEYRVWVRTTDFPDSNPGARFFNVKLGEGLYDKAFGNTGSHSGFKWEDGGTVKLEAGTIKIQLVDTSAYYARFEALLLTRDLEMIPADNYMNTLRVENVVPKRDETLEYPEWAKTTRKPGKEYEIKNENIMVKFYSVQSSNGNIVQKETFIKHNGKWIKTDNRTDGFGYLVLHADRSKIISYGEMDNCPMWDNIYTTADGKVVMEKTPDIFKSGRAEWLILSDVEVIDENTVELKGENDIAKLTAVWSLGENDMEPKVTCRLEAKKEGYYTLGMFNGPEKSLDEIDYLLCPKAFADKRTPISSYLVPEAVSTNSTSMVTLPVDKSLKIGTQATFAITIDPDTIPYRWVYKEDSKFGVGIKSIHGGIQPYAFAPLLGHEDSKFTAGQTYEITYRPIVRMEGWYDTFKYIADNLFNVRDIKKNYYSSLTDAIFNIQDLIMADERYSGWNDKAKAFAYAEGGSNLYNHSSPLTIIQNYLLTEDREFYVKRVIPTMEYMLTRGEPFSVVNTTNSAKHKDTYPKQLVGHVKSNYASSIQAGLYYMSRGLVPYYGKLGIENSIFGRTTRAGFMEDVFRYSFTGDQAVLERAHKDAQTYMNNRIYTSQYADYNTGFNILEASPYISSILSMYEVTGEKKYLDAAWESARQLIANGTWLQKVPDGDVTLSVAEYDKRGYFHERYMSTHSFALHGWNGERQYFNGYEVTGLNSEGRATGIKRTEIFDSIKDETVPAWLVSKMGMNFEHSSNYQVYDSAHITMNAYAPDLLRISKYTGDKLLETLARYAVIGRAANYPGYYVNKPMTIYMKPDYPYTGPDVSATEYTHIPAYLAILEDYLFTQAWAWSDGNVNFPALRQYGYAYFDNKVYGFAPGKFFDEEEMWPWLKRGLIEVDNIQIDWLGSRKDGVFAAALMNEDDVELEVVVSLGDEVTGGVPFNGQVYVYSADGQTTTVVASESRFKVTVPSKQMVGIKINSNAVKAPAFSKVFNSQYNNFQLENSTVLPENAEDFGTGHVLQIDPGSYFAYTYLPYKPGEISKAVLNYKIGGGQWVKQEINEYPFEYTVEVQDVNSAFEFYWEVIDNNGSRKSVQKTLKPVDVVQHQPQEQKDWKLWTGREE